jgi:hypothetical protein
MVGYSAKVQKLKVHHHIHKIQQTNLITDKQLHAQGYFCGGERLSKLGTNQLSNSVELSTPREATSCAATR